MNDRYYKAKLQCPKCKQREARYVWASKVHLEKCTTCDVHLEEIIEKIEETFAIGGQYRRGRPLKEKLQRRQKSFKEEVLPNLTGWEKKYFEKKYKK